MNHHLDTIIHRETLEEMLSVLTGYQLLILHLVLISDNFSHAADQLGCDKRVICNHIYNIRRLWENMPELAEAIEGRDPFAGKSWSYHLVTCEVCGASVYSNLVNRHLESGCTMCIVSEESIPEVAEGREAMKHEKRTEDLKEE